MSGQKIVWRINRKEIPEWIIQLVQRQDVDVRLRGLNESQESALWGYLKMVSEWRSSFISFSGKAILEPLYVLSENSFVKLKHLMLEDAYICTVEPICRMDAPILDNLNLGANRIVQFRCLRKCSFSLKELLICDNYASQFPSLPSMPLQQIQTFYINPFFYKKVPVVHDISIIFKFKIPNCRELFLGGRGNDPSLYPYKVKYFLTQLYRDFLIDNI